MSSYAILIDAGFIKRKLGSQRAPLGVEGVRRFVEAVGTHPRLRDRRMHRVYWYDAEPLDQKVRKPLAGGEINFGATALARNNKRLLEDLSREDFFSIRRGDLAFRGWKIKSHKLPDDVQQVAITAAELDPNIHQKGVDMRLGLDIAALTLKQHVELVILVAGDSDFVPAMKFARREGVQLFLVTFGHGVRRDMLEHSDLLLDVIVPSEDVMVAEGQP